MLCPLDPCEITKSQEPKVKHLLDQNHALYQILPTTGFKFFFKTINTGVFFSIQYNPEVRHEQEIRRRVEENLRQMALSTGDNNDNTGEEERKRRKKKHGKQEDEEEKEEESRKHRKQEVEQEGREDGRKHRKRRS
jgi:hypothetical protein